MNSKKQININKTLAKADLCVACGMCLPRCPTYQIAQQESESPRGRLSLISAYAKGQLEIDDQMTLRLEHCLLCQSCEEICSAKVPFGEIMDSMRGVLHQRKKTPLFKQLLLWLVSKRTRMQRLSVLLNRLYLKNLVPSWVRSGKSSIAGYLSFAKEMEPPRQWETFYPANGEQKSSVGLFLGCVEEYFDPVTVQTAIKVLNYLGVAVHVPMQQQCCGAMHLHNGDTDSANALFAKNKDAFSDMDVDAVIGLSSACTATLLSYNSAQNNKAIRFVDICSYLEEISWHQGNDLKAVQQHIYVHNPCSQRNALKTSAAVKSLLQRIPGLELTLMPETISCCGAAGTYRLDYPDWSAQLKQKLEKSICSNEYDAVVTSNIGCHMQIKSIMRTHANSSVLHPISLVAMTLL